jgi:putative ABC transport system permease protein
MKTLLRLFSWRFVEQRPLRALLHVLIVTLGVALYVAIDASNASTEAAFRRMAARLAGNAHLQVVRSRAMGVEQSILSKIDAVQGIQATPVLQITTTPTQLPAESGMLILGLDFMREAAIRRWDIKELPSLNLLTFLTRDAIVVPRSFASRHSLKLGSSFDIATPRGPRPVTIGAIAEDEGPAGILGGHIAVMEFRTAQRLFKREGMADRVDIRVAGDVEEAAHRLQVALGPGYKVRPPPESSSMLDEALTRMRALSGIGVMALLVGAFIIFNSISLSVVERQKEIGILRALGATRTQVFGTFLAEGACVGLVGSVAGAALGYGLAHALLRMAIREVNQVVTVVDVVDVVLPWGTLLVAGALGVLTALFASFVPARQATRVTPVDAIRLGAHPPRGASDCRWSCMAGLLAFGLAALCMTGLFRFEAVGLLGALLAFLGAALVLPQLTLWGARFLQPVLRVLFRLPGYLAAENLLKFPRRAALTSTVLAGTLALMVSAASIILSFKSRGTRWIEETFAYDYSVSAADAASGAFSHAILPDKLREEVEKIDGVEFTYGVREILQPYDKKGKKDILIVALDVDAYARMQDRRNRTGIALPLIRSDLAAGRGVVVSDNFAGLYGVAAGKTIELETPRGRKRFAVLAVVEDYTWPQGTIFMDRAAFRADWEDATLSSLAIKFHPDAIPVEVRRRITERAALHPGISVYDADFLARIAEETMDRTFAFTNVQVTIALLVGFLGIVNTLFISVMRRRRQIGLFRAMGMTRAQVAGMVVIESLMVALTGGVLGVALGLAAAQWPLSLFVFTISGYRIPLEIPWGSLALALGAAFAVGIVASVLPARRASRLNVIEAIGYE